MTEKLKELIKQFEEDLELRLLEYKIKKETKRVVKILSTQLGS